MIITKKRFIPKLKIILLISLFFLVTGFIFIFFFFLQVKVVEIYSPKIAISGLDKLENNNLVLLDEKNLKNNLIKNNFLIKDMTISKIYPDKLKMILKLRTSFVYLSDAASFYAVSDDGIVLKKTVASVDLPLISLEHEIITFRPGDEVDGFILSAIDLLKELNNRNFNVAKIVMNKNEGTISFNIPDSTQVLLSLTRGNQFVPPSLQIIMSRFRIEGSTPARIDFRFDKPIITLKNGDKITP